MTPESEVGCAENVANMVVSVRYDFSCVSTAIVDNAFKNDSILVPSGRSVNDF